MEIKSQTMMRALYTIIEKAMRFLSPLEQLRMQGVCKLFYATGVVEIQPSVNLASLKSSIYFSTHFSSLLSLNLLAYTSGNDFTRLKCSNIEDYTSKNWSSCQVGERMIFQVSRSVNDCRMLIVGNDNKFCVQQRANQATFRDFLCMANYKG